MKTVIHKGDKKNDKKSVKVSVSGVKSHIQNGDIGISH